MNPNRNRAGQGEHSMPQAEIFSTGRCACGAVHYALGRAPMFVHCCHCTWCQRETGSAFALNALVETAAITVLRGRPEPHHIPSESGKGQDLMRCPECACVLWSHYGTGVADRVAFVRVPTLEDPDLAPPNIHIFTDSKQAWVDLSAAAVPVVPQYYRRSDHWPADSIARFNALRE
jgi:hypothetical protein